MCEIPCLSWTNGCEIIAPNRRCIIEELPIAANDALADLQPHVRNTKSIGRYEPVQTRRDYERTFRNLANDRYWIRISEIDRDRPWIVVHQLTDNGIASVRDMG